MSIFKSYAFSQNVEVVAQKLSPPRPFQFWACKGRGSPNFCARPFKFWSSIDLLFKQMIFYKIFCISIRNSEIREKLKIWCDKWPPDGIYCQKSLIFTIGGHISWQFFSFSLIFDFLIKIQKIYKNIICLSVKDLCLTKIWRVWHKNYGCHALGKFKIEMGVAGSIFELRPPNFVKMHNF